MPSLVLFPRPGTRTRLFNIYRRITSLGRAPDNEVVLDFDGIEDHHAEIFFDGKKYSLSALERGAAIQVNAKKTKKQVLADQDILRLGDLTLQFSLYDIPSNEFTTTGVGAKDSLRKLLEFTTALMEQKDLQPLVDLMLDKIIEFTGADKGFLFILDDGIPTMYAGRNIEKKELTDEVGGFSDSILQKVLLGRKSILVSDALNDSNFSSARSVVDLKLCSVMAAPLMARGEMLGLVYLGNDNVVNLFDKEALDMLQIFASQAGLLLRNALLINELQFKNQELETKLEEIRFGRLIGASQGMRHIFKRVEKVASTTISVLITGETGVGKELFAREIHNRSPRVNGPYITVNASAIPETLLESELFGHEKGAYTGAHKDTIGKFQAAHKGTLFLDEIGDLPITLQAKILRAIEQKQVTRVGSNRPEDVDIRIIAATNKNLEEAVAKGEFRQDLYFRLNVVSIVVPPLRDRGEDTALIANYFFKQFVEQYDAKLKGFSNRSLEAMLHYPWPGNVRELENRIRKAIVLAEGDVIEPEDLEIPDGDYQVLSLADAKEQFQQDYVNRILELNGGNKTQTARDLGVDPRTIFRYLEKERSDEE